VTGLRRYANRRSEITPERLHQLLSLTGDHGRLVWKDRTPDLFKMSRREPSIMCSIWNVRYANKEAFTCVGNNGYLQGRVFNMLFLAHRVVWALSYNAWPVQHIDHIDGNKTNNSISNLREVDDLENAKNQKRHIDNKSGVTGVCIDGRSGKWLAFISGSGRRKHIGLFINFDEAVEARKIAEKHYGFSSNHGRSAWAG
jgi:HNH endonuclease